MPLFRWNSYTFLKKCINWTVLSFSHALTHSLPSSCCCPWPRGGRGKRNETPKWNPKAAFGSVLLEIVRDGLRTERVSGSAPTPVPQDPADLQKEKKNPQKKEKTVLICNCKTHLHGAELRSDPGLQQGDWAAASWKMCSPQLCWRNERNLCLWGSTRPKTWDCPLHSAHTLRNVCSSLRSLRDTLDSSQKPAAPKNNEFFWDKPVQNKQRGILSETLHTFSICPQHLQETAGGRSILTQF